MKAGKVLHTNGKLERWSSVLLKIRVIDNIFKQKYCLIKLIVHEQNLRLQHTKIETVNSNHNTVQQKLSVDRISLIVINFTNYNYS